MKKLYFILLVISITLIHNCKLVGQCSNCNSLKLNLPQNWFNIESSIESATYVVKSAGLNTLYDVYLTYTSENQYYQSQYDTFEIVQNFTLPREAAIIDSWLWVDDLIMKAQILDRSSAFNIYEGIVKRRKDPSILYKNNAITYEFRIFPIAYGKTRKVKLSILMPARVDGKNALSDLPLNLVRSSAQPTKVNVVSYLQDNQSTPTLSNNASFKPEINAELGMYNIASFTVDNNTPDIKLGFESTANKDVALMVKSLESNTNKGFFHMQIDHGQLFKTLNNNKRRVAILIDHNASYAKIGKVNLKNIIKQYISQMSSDDLIRIYYNKLDVIEATSGWTSLDSLDINALIDEINIGNNSQLINGLNTVYADLVNNKEAEVFLFSSDVSLSNQSSAQNLKDELTEAYGILNKSYILNYANFGPIIYYGNKAYVGNELFYKILASNSKGNVVNMSSYNEYYSNEQEAMDNLVAGMTDVQFESIQSHIKPASGLCYDIFSYQYGNTTTYFGKYQGMLPISFDYAFVYKDSVYHYQQTIDNPIQLTNKELLVNQIHVAQKLRDLEEKSINSSNETIIQMSIDNRVLSRYTAFLALDPNLQVPCFDCADENVTVDTDDETGIIKVTATPNPFVDKLVVRLSNVNLDNIEKILIYDVTGKQMDAEYHTDQSGNDAEITLMTHQYPTGIYLVKILVDGQWYMVKVIKAS